MATEVGAIRARMELDASQFKRQLEVVKTQTKDAGATAHKAASGFNTLESALVAVGASVTLVGLVRVVKSLADEANQLAMSMQGLVEVSKALGQNVNDVTKAAQDLATRGFMTVQQSAEALKTTLATGYGLEESISLINALSDAAAFNREAHLGWGEAVVQAVRGIKTQNSELTDAAGITTNLSAMYNRYAQSIGTTADKLSDSQKSQAAYNGMMREAQLFAGNADTAMKDYTGTQAEFNKTITVARQELGEAFIPLIQRISQILTPMISDFSKWVSSNREVVAGATALVAAITALIPVVLGLRAALIALELSFGPIGWLIAGISAVIAGVVSYNLAADAAADSVFKFARSQEELNAKLAASPLSRSAEDVKALQSDMETLNGLLVERKRIEEELANRPKDPRDTTFGVLGKQLKEIDDQLKIFGIDTPDDAPRVMKDLTQAVNAAIPAMLEMKRTEIAEIGAKIQHADKVTALRDRYIELNGVEKLSAAQKAELTGTVQQLKQEYPSLIALLDEEGRMHIDNVGILGEALTAEKGFYGTKADLMKVDLENMKKNALARKSLLDAEIASLKDFSDTAKNAPANLPAAARNAAMTSSRLADESAAKKANEMNALTLAISDIDNAVANITSGNFDAFNKKNPLLEASKGSTSAKGSKKKPKTIAEIQDDQYQKSIRSIEAKMAMNQMSETQEIESLERLRGRYSKNADIRQELDVRIYQAKKQAAENAQRQAEESAKKTEESRRKAFDNSSEWIDAEVRRLREKGATEDEIAQFTLQSWTRVRNRYKSDTEYYKSADIAMYNARMTLIERSKKADEEAVQVKERSVKDLTDKTLRSIRDIERAQMDALDNEKREIERRYDDKIDAVDDTERQRERAKLLVEQEKYRLSASKDGQEKYADLTEQLRKMDVDDNKRSLERQKRDELDKLEERKRNIEAYFHEVERAFETSGGIIGIIEKLTQDSRLSLLKTTNADMIKELQTYVDDYNRIMVSKSSATQGPTISNQQRYLESLVSSGNAGQKKWAEDQLKQSKFHTGGIVGSGNFRIGDKLMPDEISAILKRGEVVFTEKQVAGLFTGRGSSETQTPVTKTVNITHNGDVKIEDSADAKTYWSERDIAAQRLLAGGDRD